MLERHSGTAGASGRELAARGEGILVVDDEPANVLLLRRILARAGYSRVVGTSEAGATLELLAAHEPDIVLLDLHMPGVDGFELLSLLNERLRAELYLPVLVLTADASPATRREALEAGASDFLLKPFDAVEVVLRIRNLLETRRLHLRLRAENVELEERVGARTADLERAQAEVLERLAQAAELHDDDTGQHTRRVGESCAAIAAALALPAETVALLRRTGPLHDLGKIGIPDEILRKPGRLSAEERSVMQGHAEIGARILAGGRSEAIRMAEEIARSHHERWDGAGYPHGLRGEEIPLAARIVAAADVYDALAHDRPYRPALARERAAAHIREGSGTHFDPRVADAFLALLAHQED